MPDEGGRYNRKNGLCHVAWNFVGRQDRLRGKRVVLAWNIKSLARD